VFPNVVVHNIIDENDDALKQVCNKYDVTIKFDPEQHIRGMSKIEQITVRFLSQIIQGSKTRVQKATLEILNMVNAYYENKKDDYQKQALRIVINNSFVTKLIGPSKPVYAEGSTIARIAGNSGGAQIKILSNKETEKYEQDCIIMINGNLERKKDAVCNIFDKLETIRIEAKREQGQRSPAKHPRKFERARRSRSRSSSAKFRKSSEPRKPAVIQPLPSPVKIGS
jgi:hypothetical protein